MCGGGWVVGSLTVDLSFGAGAGGGVVCVCGFDACAALPVAVDGTRGRYPLVVILER